MQAICCLNVSVREILEAYVLWKLTHMLKMTARLLQLQIKMAIWHSYIVIKYSLAQLHKLLFYYIYPLTGDWRKEKRERIQHS